MANSSGKWTAAAMSWPDSMRASAATRVTSVPPSSSTLIGRASQKQPTPVFEAQKGPDQQAPVDPSVQVIVDQIPHDAAVEELEQSSLALQQLPSHVVDALPAEP